MMPPKPEDSNRRCVERRQQQLHYRPPRSTNRTGHSVARPVENVRSSTEYGLTPGQVDLCGRLRSS